MRRSRQRASTRRTSLLSYGCALVGAITLTTRNLWRLTLDSPWAWGWTAVEALATVAAFVAAGLAVYFAWCANKQLHRDAALAEERRRADQASLVGAWFVEYRRLRVKNASTMPVFSVRMWLVPEDGTALYLKYRQLEEPSSESREVDLEQDVLSAVQAWRDSRAPADRPPIPCVMTFRDTHNQWWLRDESGGLNEITADQKRPYPTPKRPYPTE